MDTEHPGLLNELPRNVHIVAYGDSQFDNKLEANMKHYNSDNGTNFVFHRNGFAPDQAQLAGRTLWVMSNVIYYTQNLLTRYCSAGDKIISIAHVYNC